MSLSLDFTIKMYSKDEDTSNENKVDCSEDSTAVKVGLSVTVLLAVLSST